MVEVLTNHSHVQHLRVHKGDIDLFEGILKVKMSRINYTP